MSLVTVPPVSVKVLQTLLSKHLSAYTSLKIIARAFPQCKTSRSTKKATGTRGPALCGTLQGRESV